ncbi:uncharacterized BrkB/YihY/UPF0761 family membrane protein [Bacillus sp. SORGH_AS 510]|uniref:hypothetical protein n=1 Tax=Bacillus sp. SORGH_AS_0510 TaxID=3041771 RepID=UPI00277E8567|nr:hypothetical protein [Bacillus sp. SORGH_AS_0510]MDQ1144035.1 uncharacterized BrkB/YihY/UPF0761 family membrane protein [Bacillus sp. SORGH_AS_0510]
MKNSKITVTITFLVILVLGIISIYLFAPQNERPMLVLMLGAVMILFQRLAFYLLKIK